jgi:hypothetical protein
MLDVAGGVLSFSQVGSQLCLRAPSARSCAPCDTRNYSTAAAALPLLVRAGLSLPAHMRSMQAGCSQRRPLPLQVMLDALARHDLSVITGNPAKLWVAGLSIG